MLCPRPSGPGGVVTTGCLVAKLGHRAEARAWQSRSEGGAAVLTLTRWRLPWSPGEPRPPAVFTQRVCAHMAVHATRDTPPVSRWPFQHQPSLQPLPVQV